MIRRVTIEDIRRISQRSRQVLYGDDLASVSVGTPDSGQDSVFAARPDSQTANPQSTTSKPEQELAQQTNTSKPLRNAYQVMRTQHEYDQQFLFRRESAILSHLKGGATLLETEKAALRHNLIVKHFLPRGKTNVCFWEIIDQGYELLESTRPKWKSKGDYRHKFSVYRIANTYQRLGYLTEIEHRRSNGKLVDLLLSKGQKVVYLEVCASWPIQKELVNIQKDLEGEPLPDEIILAVTERKMREPLEQAVREISACTALLRPIRIVLAGDLIEFLEIEG